MDRYDVAILGGGLSGLTLGLQLKKARPETSILIVEKRKGPAPHAAFKVGESSVEMSAHYFADVVGMRDHLEANELPKAGLRFFFPAGDNSDITRRLEWGAFALPPVPSFQLDRGTFENAMTERNVEKGNEVRGATRVTEVDFGADGEEHTVTLDTEGDESQVRARWVVDASGYPGIIKRKLGLQKPVEHNINSAWFRLTGGIDLEQWGAQDAEWIGRMSEPGIRKLSTNHLMGEGYWVWLIPLGTGPISVGIVADPRFHPFEEIETWEKALDWLKRHEPQLAAEVEPRQDQIEDFLKVQNFAYSCQRVFSPDRWALTGIAGVFADPFYSPGSDFIAQGNTFITDLVCRDLAGEDVGRRTLQYDVQYVTSFETAIQGTYTNHYQLFGNAQVMTAKLLWEFAAYWAVVALPFFNEKLTDLEFSASVGGEIRRIITAGARLEEMFRQWHQLGQHEWGDAFIVNRSFPAFWQLHLDLDERFDDDALRQKFRENADLLEGLAVVIFHTALESLPPDDRIDADTKINPAKISLSPEKWEKDRLFSDDGISLDEARSRTGDEVDKVLLRRQRSPA